MHRVIVVDDERIALKYICSIIEKKCPDYEVVATAEEGMEALQKVEEYQPDLVISDIKMPLMSGIDLVAEIHERYPDIYAVIVSGYSDFEYARSMMKLGVSDYILKPVVPSEMVKTLEKISRKISRSQYEMCTRLIHRLCGNEACDEKVIRRFFPYDQYYCAVIRRNGLPKRFGTGGSREIFSEVNESYMVYGRDEMEQLYIIPRELLNGRNISAYIVELSQKMRVDTDYMTIVYYKESCPPKELQGQIKRLYRTLNAVSVVGQNQMLGLNKESREAEIEYDHPTILEVLNQLEYLLKNKRYTQLKKELNRLYTQWSYERKPQMWMESITRQIIYMLNRYEESSLSSMECEYMLEDAFFYAGTSQELITSLLDILFQNIKKISSEVKVDSPEFVDAVELYIQRHLSEDLSLQNVSRQFNISQTYMGKLIRKYRDDSFNHYLTRVRMQKATELMRDKPGLYIKDVAQMAGYHDQFYFSRIFRSYMGVCPSDYLENTGNLPEEQ